MKSYCTQNDGHCETCSLVSYRRDCMNNSIDMVKYELFCKKDPKALGIEDDNGGWDMVKLADHTKTCRKCKAITAKIAKDLKKLLR